MANLTKMSKPHKIRLDANKTKLIEIVETPKKQKNDVGHIVREYLDMYSSAKSNKSREFFMDLPATLDLSPKNYLS